MSAAAIETQKLSKRYAGTDSFALKNLTLTVQPGEIYGFLGPNGAGKSTAIRTLMNFIQPSDGQARIMGLDVVNDSVAVKSKVGYQAGEVALYGRMTGQEFLTYMAALQPVKDTAYLKKIVQQFQADLDKPIEQLSKGNRQKLGVIQAIMHQPEVLILDEPTSGLDPLMQSIFYEAIEAAKQRGAAIFLSSHDLAEVRKMCDRIGFIRSGELVAEQTLAELQQTAAHNFEITFQDKTPMTELKKLQGATVTKLTEHAVSVNVQGDLKPLFAILAKNNVVALEKHEVNLEEEFLRLDEDPHLKPEVEQ
jgi:ABC-2 type transport system ATP-binding protein